MGQIIYLVVENIQNSDYDYWSYDVVTENKSYHLTEEGAKAKIAELIAAQVSLVKDWTGDTPEELERNKELLSKYENNLVTIVVGSGMNTVRSDYPWFFIDPIELEN